MKEYKLEIALSVLCLVLIGFLLWVAATTSPPDPEAYRCRGVWYYGFNGKTTSMWYNPCRYMVPKEEK